MSIRTRAVAIFSALVFVVAAAIVTVSAQAPGRGARGMGPGRGEPGGPFPGLQRLDLTEAQREQIKTILAEQTRPADRQSAARLQQELQAAVMADTPDLGAIEQLKSSIAAAQATALNERVDLQLRIAQQVLTAEQRQKARATPLGPGGRGRGPGPAPGR